ncbi:hypothetical protein SASPL_128042 [Salvia splendens]|uniref:mTERF domain-containing protein, mitochondrial n=1 Tax=Salvia splendens TaxID=180675 RepID=A0A8X8XDA8_SALSN|nr:hypothetical protein SASPL_128042 [Salvia splendens]
MYESLGLSKNDLITVLLSRPTLIPRTNLNEEKIDYIRRTGGLSEDDYLGLIGCSPLVLTLSVDKVQRNMTYILGTMKLPASVVVHNPFLIFFNLERVLKPRFQIACKIEDMGLAPQIKGPLLLRAMRMSDKRFTKAFISCHPESVAKELLTAYKDAKCVKRLAESSKKNLHTGFPF